MTYDWLVYNYGPRCTLVSAASALQYLGARGARKLVAIIEAHVQLSMRFGTLPWCYVGYLGPVGIKSQLDRGIEEAARQGGIRVKSATHFLVSRRRLVRHLQSGQPAVLNCISAPGGSRFHSVVAVSADGLIGSVDPNTGELTLAPWRFIDSLTRSVTFVTLLPAPKVVPL
jgi:hypothetical protein